MSNNPLLQRDAHISSEVNLARKVEYKWQKARAEYYEHCPGAEFQLPSVPHHWFIVQTGAGPKEMLIDHGVREVSLGSRLREDHIIYIPPFTRTEWQFSEVKGCVHVLLPDSLLLDAVDDFDALDALYSRGASFGEFNPSLCQHIRKLAHTSSQPEPVSPLALFEYLSETALLYANEVVGNDRAELKGSTKGMNQKLLHRLKEYLWSNLHHPVGVEELASLSGMSAGYFHRSFKEFTKTTPHKFVTCMRIAKSRTYLAKKMDLAQVAQLCGFADQAHFTRIFKLWTGYTPSFFVEATC